MRLRSYRPWRLPAVLSGAAWLAFTASSAAQPPQAGGAPALYWPPAPCPAPDWKPLPPPPCPVVPVPAVPAPPAAPAPAQPRTEQPRPEQPRTEQPQQEPQAPQVEQPTDTSSPFTGASQVAAFGGAGGTINMMGDLLSGPTLRCVSVPRVVTRPVTRFITPQPVLVQPPAFNTTFSATGTPPSFVVQPPQFTFTPTSTVQPPPVLVQPPPIVLPNGQVVPVPAYFATPAPVPVSGAPVNALPAPVTVQPAPVTVNGIPANVRPAAFTSQPAPVAVTETVTMVVLEQECYQVLAAAARASAFKIAENESPAPQDRAYLTFNYFNNVNDEVNQRLGDNISNMWVTRETIGFERTFFDGWTSVEVRLPLSTLTVTSNTPGLSDTDIRIGDLSVGLKAAIFMDRETGDVFSTGLVLTSPTGPLEYNPFNSFIIQPWGGYRYFFGENLYVHGFSSIAVPTDSRDVTLWFNDVAVGYFVYRNASPEVTINGIVPTLEVHVNTPLNHRGAFNFADPAGTPDWVTLTAGTTLVVGRSTLALGGGIPVTGPKPYDFEILAQYNLRF